MRSVDTNKDGIPLGSLSLLQQEREGGSLGDSVFQTSFLIFSTDVQFLSTSLFNFGTWFSIRMSSYLSRVKTNQIFEHASCSHVFRTGSHFQISNPLLKFVNSLIIR
jgi:hypothetical protein